MEDRKDDEGTVGWEERFGWSRRVNLSRPLATLSRRAILRITSAASGQEMKIAPTLFNLDKSICYTTNGVAGWYILEEATLCLSSEGICAGMHIGHENILFSRICARPRNISCTILWNDMLNCSIIYYIHWHIFEYVIVKGFIYVYKTNIFWEFKKQYHSFLILRFLFVFLNYF